MVMGVIMLMVAVSRGLAVPTYLNKLGLMHITDATSKLLSDVSFAIMCLSLLIGASIILYSTFKARRLASLEAAQAGHAQA